MRYRKVCLENTWKHSKFPTVQPFLSPFAEGGSMTPSFLGWISWRTDQRSPLKLSKMRSQFRLVQKNHIILPLCLELKFFLLKRKEIKTSSVFVGAFKNPSGFYVSCHGTSYGIQLTVRQLRCFGSWSKVTKKIRMCHGSTEQLCSIRVKIQDSWRKNHSWCLLVFLFMGMTYSSHRLI